jgi:basic membrane lipoprotein Med (substrate-binding protein (PBP1-ABC) superfamily)
MAAEIYGFEPIIVEAETLAQEGFHIIFGHCGKYASPFFEISGMYPNTIFITAGGNVVTDNQMVAEFVPERLTCIQGVMAGRLTKTKKVGAIVGGSFPAYTKTSRAFETGVKFVVPSIESLFGITQKSADMNEGYVYCPRNPI